MRAASENEQFDSRNVGVRYEGAEDDVSIAEMAAYRMSRVEASDEAALREMLGDDHCRELDAGIAAVEKSTDRAACAN